MNGMMPIARNGLRYLRKQRLRVTQQQILRGAGPAEFVQEQLSLQPESVAGAAHDHPMRRCYRAEEDRDADDSFAAHESDLVRRAVFHYAKQRHYRGSRKINVIQLA